MAVGGGVEAEEEEEEGSLLPSRPWSSARRGQALLAVVACGCGVRSLAIVRHWSESTLHRPCDTSSRGKIKPRRVATVSTRRRTLEEIRTFLIPACCFICASAPLVELATAQRVWNADSRRLAPH